MQVKDRVCQLIRNANDGDNCIAKHGKQRNKLSSMMTLLREAQASRTIATSVRLAVPVPIAARSDMHAHHNLHMRCTQID